MKKQTREQIVGRKLAANVTNRQLRLHIKGLEAQVASLTKDIQRIDDDRVEAVMNAEASETVAEKWRNHAAHIQNLAAEGKDPLTGEEPEFWLVWRWNLYGDRTPTYRHSDKLSAVNEAHRLSRQHPGDRFYILPAFDYAICEVSPVTWKRKSAEKADDEQEFPF